MLTAIESIKNIVLSSNVFSNTTVNPKHIINSIMNTENSERLIGNMVETTEPIPKNEPEQVDIYDKRPYTVINKASKTYEDFHYLHGEQLSQSYNFCLQKSSILQIHLCIVGLDFHCNYDKEHLPFLRFLMQRNADKIEFPHCEIACSLGDTENDMESRENEMDIYFRNECKLKLLDLFGMDEFYTKTMNIGEILKTAYRGYKEIGDNEIVVVFDITQMLKVPLKVSRNPIWIVADDFIQGVLPFSPKISRFFEENKYMIEIRDPLNNLVDTPKSLYLYNTETHDFMRISEKSEWIEPRSRHSMYGNFYYLKFSGVQSLQLINTYRKCVVFLKNYRDFIEHNMCGSSQGEHTQTDELPVYISSNDFDIDENANVIEGDDISTRKVIRNDILNALPFVSLILFTSSGDKLSPDNPRTSMLVPNPEVITEKGEPIYCVKTESIFMEL
jgi:hypothetical protein